MTFREAFITVPWREWVLFACCFAGIALFIALAEKTRSALNWSPEVTRKLVHICTGILLFFSPFFFSSNIPLLVMAVLFILFNFAGVQTGKLMGMHGTERKSYGTVFYPLAVLILVSLFWRTHRTVMMISFLILALADAGAAIVGENLKKPHIFRWSSDKKSIEGSVVMFFISFCVVFFILPLIESMEGVDITWHHAAGIASVTAVISTVLEALSSKGSDNLTSPLGAAFILHFMLNQSASANLNLTLGMILAGLVAVISYGARFLTAAGSAGTFLLATLVFGTGGWTWSVPILTFFILSSLLSKLGRVHKAKFSDVFEKASRRDLGQVMANGGLAAIILIFAHFFHDSIWFPLYLGTLAAVNADTWATEIGVFSKHHPRSIVGFRIVPPGTSGGITVLGSFSALAGSVAIAASGWLVSGEARLPFQIVLLISLAGLMGSFIDSILGATVQAQYRCPACGKTTEKRIHCSHNQTRLVSGSHLLNNDGVNALCALAGALFVWAGITIS